MDQGTYIKFAIREGKILAGYLSLPRREGDSVAYSEEIEGGWVIDFTEDGRPIGIEITAPSAFSLEELNKILKRLGQQPLVGRVLAPTG